MKKVWIILLSLAAAVTADVCAWAGSPDGYRDLTDGIYSYGYPRALDPMVETIRTEYDEIWGRVKELVSGILIKGAELGKEIGKPPEGPPEMMTSGNYGYRINEDNATVTIAEYTGNEDVIEIPSEIDGYPVSEIGQEAFSYIKIASLSLPGSVLCIAQRAFEYCVISDMLQLPENVTIEKDAFSYAELPFEVTIPAGAAAEEGAFSYCRTIRRLWIGSDAVIKGRAFGYCNNLEQVVCAGGSRLETDAFEYCGELKSVMLCGTVETEEDAFSYCGDIEMTGAEESEYEALKQSGADGALSDILYGEGGGNPSPEEPGETALEILGSPASLDGVTVTLDKAAAKRSDTGGFEYSFSGTIENNSEEGIMRVIYTFALMDEAGEEYRSFGEVYDEEDKAIPPHTKAEFSHEGIKWGPQSVPFSVRIGISSVQTEAELPPARLPEAGEFLYQALGDEKLANIKENPPVELSFHVDQGGYGRTATFHTGEALDRAVSLFCGIKIGAESDEWVTDNYNWIEMEWEDGSRTGISLNLYNLEYYAHSAPHTFRLEHLDEFWSYAAGFLKEDE